MSKRKLITFVVIVLLLIGFYLGYRTINNPKGDGSMPPAVVTTEIAKAILWQDSLTAVGSLLAEQGVMLQPEVAGRVSALYFESGTLVKKGDLLLELNPDILKAQVNSANATLELVRANFSRSQDLFKRKVLPQSDYDASLAALDEAKARVEQIKAQLNQVQIHAPFDGRLGLRLVSLGDFVSAGQNLVNLQSTDPLLMDFAVPESRVNEVHIGQKVVINSDAFAKEESFSGTLTAIDSAVSSQTRMLNVRAAIPNPTGKLLPGTFVRVTLYTSESKPYIQLPLTALVYTEAQPFVYKVVEGRAVAAPVTTGVRQANNVVIVSGLTEGDEVVTAGQVKLFPGAAIAPSANNTKQS